MRITGMENITRFLKENIDMVVRIYTKEDHEVPYLYGDVAYTPVDTPCGLVLQGRAGLTGVCPDKDNIILGHLNSIRVYPYETKGQIIIGLNQ